ncbi:hypothetical protein BSKO_00491 [Bryopsis sp. KO-2023]|nr:hypothetical protein BSKO_00491 [Bryopsis sp. KO-2023]
MVSLESCASLVVAVCCLFLVSVDAKTIVVGGKEKWTIPRTRFRNISARVGDVLRFEYDGVHTVVQTKGPGCDFEGKKDLAGVGDSPLDLTLKKPGRLYFACDIPSHCPAGMSVTVTVRDAKKKRRSPARRRSKPKPAAKKSDRNKGKKTSKTQSSKKVNKSGKGGTATVELGGKAEASAGGGK